MKKTIFLLSVIFLCLMSQAQNKKDIAKSGKSSSANYTVAETISEPDTANKFTGIIKYHMTSDDPYDRDSIFIVFGETQIRVIMFIPGSRENQVIERSVITNFADSSVIELDSRKDTYKKQKLADKNKGTELSVIPDKKKGQILNFTCQEFKGEMKTSDGEVYESACLVSSKHSYIATNDYNFLGIQPLVMSNKIVLGFRTKSSDNENTYIVAYKIEPGNPDQYFDLSKYKAL